MRIAMFLAAAVTLSAPVAAKSNQLAEAKQETTAKPSSEKKICRTIAATGSRMGDRVCLTKEQWKKVDEESAG